MDDRYYGFVLIDECDSVLTYDDFRTNGIDVRATSLESEYQRGLHGVNGLFLSASSTIDTAWLEYNNLVLMNVVVPKFPDGRLISEPEAELWIGVSEDEPASDWYTVPVSERGWTKITLSAPEDNPVDVRGKISATMCLQTIYHTEVPSAPAPKVAKKRAPQKAEPVAPSVPLADVPNAKQAPIAETPKVPSLFGTVDENEVARQRSIYQGMFSRF